MLYSNCSYYQDADIYPIFRMGSADENSRALMNFYYYYYFCFLVAYGGSQTRGWNRSYSCWPTPQPQQCRIWSKSVTYTTAHGNARSLTHWGRPGIKPTSLWMLVEFPLSHNGNFQLQILQVTTLPFITLVQESLSSEAFGVSFKILLCEC